jgi:hypothetical protein
VLYLVSRPGNATSQQGAAEWIDRAIALVQPYAGSICLRGDTDFSQTTELDRWDKKDVKFVFGIDAHPKLVALAEGLGEGCWRKLMTVKPEIKTEPRTRPEKVKEQIVKEREYLNRRLVSEQVAEFSYQPVACQKSYRLVVLRKNLSVERGEKVLLEDVRYFFYITNRTDLAWDEVVQFAHERGDQENVIAQLKSGVNAMRMPVDNLESNWAGHGRLGLESESLVWTVGAGSGAWAGVSEDGIPDFSPGDHPLASADHSDRAQDYISDPELQSVAEGFLCDLGAAAAHGSDLSYSQFR